MQAEAALGRSQEELQEFAAAADAARDQDKIRIARELHDEFGVLLTMLRMDVTWCKENLPAGDRESPAGWTRWRGCWRGWPR